MTARRYDGATFQDLTHFRRWSGSAWTDATHARRWDGSQWVEFWPVYTNIVATISPDSYNNTRANNTGPVSIGFNAVVTGGNGSPTYTWGITGSGLSITGGQGTSSVTVEIVNGSNQFYSGTLSLTVADGTSSDSATAPISQTYGTPD